jgi:hypothetical protein
MTEAQRAAGERWILGQLVERWPCLSQGDSAMDTAYVCRNRGVSIGLAGWLGGLDHDPWMIALKLASVRLPVLAWDDCRMELGRAGVNC